MLLQRYKLFSETSKQIVFYDVESKRSFIYFRASATIFHLYSPPVLGGVAESRGVNNIKSRHCENFYYNCLTDTKSVSIKVRGNLPLLSGHC